MGTILHLTTAIAVPLGTQFQSRSPSSLRHQTMAEAALPTVAKKTTIKSKDR